MRFRRDSQGRATMAPELVLSWPPRKKRLAKKAPATLNRLAGVEIR
jgi:hypothetical protein